MIAACGGGDGGCGGGRRQQLRRFGRRRWRRWRRRRGVSLQRRRARRGGWQRKTRRRRRRRREALEAGPAHVALVVTPGAVRYAQEEVGRLAGVSLIVVRAVEELGPQGVAAVPSRDRLHVEAPVGPHARAVVAVRRRRQRRRRRRARRHARAEASVLRLVFVAGGIGLTRVIADLFLHVRRDCPLVQRLVAVARADVLSARVDGTGH